MLLGETGWPVKRSSNIASLEYPPSKVAEDVRLLRTRQRRLGIERAVAVPGDGEVDRADGRSAASTVSLALVPLRLLPESRPPPGRRSRC